MAIGAHFGRVIRMFLAASGRMLLLALRGSSAAKRRVAYLRAKSTGGPFDPWTIGSLHFLALRTVCHLVPADARARTDRRATSGMKSDLAVSRNQCGRERKKRCQGIGWRLVLAAGRSMPELLTHSVAGNLHQNFGVEVGL